MKAVAVSSESCVVYIICPHKLSIQPTYDLALHQSACYLLATRVKKEQQTILYCQKAAIRELQPLNILCACAHTPTCVKIHLIVRSYIDPGNPGKPQCLPNAYHIHNSFLSNARLRIYFLQTMPLLVVHPFNIH